MAVRQGALARAVRELRRARELCSDDPEIAAALGRALLSQPGPAARGEGVRWLRYAADQPGASPDLVIEAALADPDPASAIALLRERLVVRPHQPVEASPARLVATLALRLSQIGAHAEAQEMLSRVEGADDHQAVHLVGVRWRIAAAAGRYDEALGAAVAAARAGRPPRLRDAVPLALGTRKLTAVRELLGAMPKGDHESGDSLRGDLEAFSAETAGESALRRLARLAPDDDARRFVARQGATPPPSAGDLIALLNAAHELSLASPALSALAPRVARAREAYDRPLLLAVMGEFNVGKSSLVNALAGFEVMPVGVTPTTATLNVLRQGEDGGRVIYHDGRVLSLPRAAVVPFLAGLAGRDAGAIRAVEIVSKTPALARIEIVDTPGLNAARPDHEATSRGFLTEADAILWVFSAGQAAKASEREALALARHAGKPVLAVVNKIDHVDEAERPAVMASVREGLGDVFVDLLPLAARRARSTDGTPGPELAAILLALERNFIDPAPALKRRSALSAVNTWVADARRIGEAIGGGERPRTVARESMADERAKIHVALTEARALYGVALGETLARAAHTIADLLAPRGGLQTLLAGAQVDDADESFVADLLEEVVASTVTRALAVVRAASVGGGSLADVVAVAADRFAAYARGRLRGGVVRKVLGDLGAESRLDDTAAARVLGRALPDPEAELFSPLAELCGAAVAAAEAAAEDVTIDVAVAGIFHEERFMAPLLAVERAADELARADDPRS
jgi:small GTP-binding protein